MLFQNDVKLYQETVIPLVPILVLVGVSLIIIVTVIILIVSHNRRKKNRG